MAERNPSPERQKVLKLIKDIRRSDKYQRWRQRVIDRDVPSWVKPKFRKGIQVHHKKEITHILFDNGVTTLNQAMVCEELWDMENAVTLKRGEHFILTKLGRYKYITDGFRYEIEKWLKGTHRGFKRD